MIIEILASVGFILSCYAYYVEKKAADKKFKPVCDINENISCTKAFLSEYGKILGKPNSFFGIFFYPIVFILFYLNVFSFVFYLSLLSAVSSVYLAYLSYVKLKNFCLVCTGVYLVNFLLLFFSYKLLQKSI